MNKILLLCASSNSVKNFRVSLIKKLQQEGYQVGVSAFDEDNKELIESLGVDFFCIKSKNRSLNPLQFLKQRKHYLKLVKQYKPNVVMTFVLKPNTIGVLASHKAGVKNIYSVVEGAGDAFVYNSFKWKVIRFVICLLYKKSFKKSKKVFFLNTDDKAEFIKRKLVSANKCELINGIGVDLDKFEEKPLKNTNTFLMIARMLKTKGVYEYCECAREVKKTHPEVTFNYIGAQGSVKLADIQQYIDDGSICYLGTTKDVRPFIEDCFFLVLPSYREGFPMSVMEAEAVGRGIITTDSVGCRDTVVDGYNGFLVKVGNVNEMVEKCIWAIENPTLATEMCKNARIYASEHFDSKIINQKVFEIITQEVVK